MTLYYVNDDNEWMSVDLNLVFEYFGRDSVEAEWWRFLIKREVREDEMSWLSV